MKPENLQDMLRTTLRDNPRASEAEIRQKCWEICSTDPALVQSLFEYWFANSYDDFEVVVEPFSTAVMSTKRSRAAPSLAERAPIEKTREVVAALKNTFKVCLMDFALSDGTRLKDATFGQCLKEGGWLTSIGKAGKVNAVVGKKLVEDDVQRLAVRHDLPVAHAA